MRGPLASGVEKSKHVSHFPASPWLPVAGVAHIDSLRMYANMLYVSACESSPSAVITSQACALHWASLMNLDFACKLHGVLALSQSSRER